jgi:hypothetical protein
LEETKNERIEGSRARIDGYQGISDKRKIEAYERAEKIVKLFNIVNNLISIEDFI